MTKKKSVHRDAGTGKFVTKRYADKHPKTTVKETVKTTNKLSEFFLVNSIYKQ